jgi:hypothetical protein
MKLYVLILSFLVFITEINSQVNTLSNQKGKISLGLVQSLNVSYRISSSSSDLEWMELGLDSIEKPNLGNSTAVLANIGLSERFQLNTGLSRAKMGYQYKEGSLIGHTYYREEYNFIELPVHLIYKTNSKKSYCYMSIGLTSAFVYNSSARYKLEGQNNELRMKLNSNITDFQFTTRFGLGMSFYLSEYWNLKSELFYNQALQSISNGPIKKSLFSTGLNFGLFRSL